MSDTFFDDYYTETKDRLEKAKEAYKLVHQKVGNEIESQFLSKFDLDDPRRSKATLRSISGIRKQFEGFEDRLFETEKIVAFAAIQRDQFVYLTGIERANQELLSQRAAGFSTDDPLDRALSGLSDLRRLREGLSTAGRDMDAARRKANLLVGALRDAIGATLYGRVELLSAFASTELPRTVLQALKALRDVSADQASERIGEAIIEAVKEVAPEIAAELVRINTIVRTYQALAEAFGAYDLKTSPEAPEAAQRLWEAMEAEEDAYKEIKAQASKVAREITIS